MLPRLFFEHFRETSFVVEQADQISHQADPIVAFLIGFLSQSQPDEAYIHFVGVRPAYRKQQLASTLYELFFETARQHNRAIRRCLTSPLDTAPIACPTYLRFQIEPQESQLNGVSYDPNHDGLGQLRISCSPSPVAGSRDEADAPLLNITAARPAGECTGIPDW